MGGPFQSFDWLEPFFDKRLKVPLPIDYPYSVHGLIIAEFNQGVISRGTGTLIGEDTVLTAAHCLYHKYHPLDKEFHPAHTIFFIPSIHLKPSFKLDSIEIKGLKADKFFVHKDYLNNDENFDFVVIKLSYPLGFNVGFAQIVAHKDEALQSLKVNVTGYPAHKGVI